MKRTRAALAAALAAALVAALFPGLALAEDRDGAVGIAGITYEVDEFDAAGMGDGTPALARDITAYIADHGGDWYENHTLDLVNGTSGDSDWVKFTVTPDDVNLDQTTFLIRTQSTAAGVDTVIELYGPGSGFAYTLGHLAGSGDPLAVEVNDEDIWRSAYTHDSALLFRPAAPGVYYVRIRPWSNAGTYIGDAGPYRLHLKRGVFQRIAGADRIQTAIAVSQLMFTATDAPATLNISVVIADAYNYPDALTGSVLAGISDGPLLLTSGSTLSAGVGQEILRIGANRVYVVGGSDVVSDGVFSQIQALHPGIGVYRVAGDDRCMTASEIALQARSDAPGYAESMSNLAIIAYGWNFPDALAATALSAARNVPVLLTGATTLNEDAEEALFHLGTTDVVIVGGPDVVSSVVEDQLKAILGSTHVLRIGGTDRYETAKMFASWACDLTGPGSRGDNWIGTPGSPNLMAPLRARYFGIASGEDFPDALSGGSACGLIGSPILLTRKANPYGYIAAEHDGALPPGHTDWVSDYHTIYPATPFEHGLIFGGPAAIETSTMAILDNSVMLVSRP
jgi:putative cell wall-binding protein